MTQINIDEIIDKVDGNTTLVGRHELDTAVSLCAKKNYIFHTDDVWSYAPNFTGNRKSLAGALKRAIANKIITHDGFAKSTSSSRHHGITSRYKSNDYRGF